jgi:hypothetical protein
MADEDEFGSIIKKYGGGQPDEFAAIGSKYGKPEPSVAWDVAKQIPSGLALGLESMATFPAHALGFVGGLAEKYIPGAAPSPEQAASRQRLAELTAAARGGGVAQYLPEPATTAGKYARTTSEFLPATVAGSTLAIPRALGVGATAGLVSEAAGQGAEAVFPEAAPYARAGGALLAGYGAGRFAEPVARAAAAKQGIAAAEAAGNEGFEAFRKAGFALDPAAATTYTTSLKADLTGRGLTASTADRTWKVLDDIERNPYIKPVEFQDRYKELGSVARKSTDSEERLAANIAQQRLLQSLDNLPPGMVQGGDPAAGVALLRDANLNWAAAKRAENVSGRITKAEQVAAGQHSGLGLENELRRRISVLADPTARGGGRGFTAEELKAFEQYGAGTPAQNFRRWAMNLGGGRGGIAATVVGGGAGFGLGSDPVTGTAYGVGIPLAALGLAKYGNMRALTRARDLELMLLQRSPQGGAGIPRSGAPYSLAAPTLATIGENYQE